jgi:predicted transcriptional regulator
MSQPAQKVHLGVMVREEQRRELAALARREDRSVSSVTRAAIDAYLASEHAQPAREGAAR